MEIVETLRLAAAVLIQEGQPQTADDTGVKIVAGALALILVGIIILRRKKKKKAEDEF